MLISEIAVTSTAIVDTDLGEKETAAGESQKFTFDQVKAYVLAGIPTSTLWGRTIFVDEVFGDDSTGMINSLQYPFATSTAARAAGSARDLIWVRPGSYTDNLMGGVEGINYHFEEGAVVTSSNNFYDAGGANFSVSGKGEFIVNGNGNCVIVTGSGNKVFIECKSMLNNGNGVTIRGYDLGSSDTELVINATGNIESNGANGTVRLDASQKMYIKCNKMIGNGGIISALGYADSVMIIHTNKYEYNADGIGYVAFNLENGTLQFHGDFYGTGTGLYGAPVLWFDSWNGDDHRMDFYGNIYSTCTDPILWCSGNAGICYIHGTINAVSEMHTSSGIIHLKDDVVNTRTGAGAYTHLGGITIVYGLVKNLDGAGYGIEVAGAGLILKQTAAVVGTVSIYAAAPNTVKCYPGACVNSTPDANISQTVYPLLEDGGINY